MSFIRKNYSLDPKNVQHVKQLADKSGFKVSEIVNQAITEYLNKPRTQFEIVIERDGIVKTWKAQ